MSNDNTQHEGEDKKCSCSVCTIMRKLGEDDVREWINELQQRFFTPIEKAVRAERGRAEAALKAGIITPKEHETIRAVFTDFILRYHTNEAAMIACAVGAPFNTIHEYLVSSWNEQVERSGGVPVIPIDGQQLTQSLAKAVEAIRARQEQALVGTPKPPKGEPN